MVVLVLLVSVLFTERFNVTIESHSFELFNDMCKYLLAEILIGFDITIESEIDKLLIYILIASESGNPMCRVWLLVNKY